LFGRKKPTEDIGYTNTDSIYEPCGDYDSKTNTQKDPEEGSADYFGKELYGYPNFPEHLGQELPDFL